jgi:hypothetical protein
MPAGLSVDDQGVSIVVRGIDSEPTLLTRGLGDTAWSSSVLVSGSAIGGALAGRTALVVRMDPMAMTVELIVAVDGRVDIVASDCDVVLGGSAWLLAPDLLVHQCSGDQVLARRSAAGWSGFATLPNVLLDGAVGSDGTIYVLDTDSAPPVRMWTIGPERTTESTVDGVRRVGDVATCGARLYATFEQPYERGALPALGVWNGEAWQLETVAGDVAGAGLLAFDEGCHPFIAIGDVVYGRGPAGWVGAPLGVPGAWIDDLAAHGGRIYATYHVVTDASHAGFAFAPLVVAD